VHFSACSGRVGGSRRYEPTVGLSILGPDLRTLKITSGVSTLAQSRRLLLDSAAVNIAAGAAMLSALSRSDGRDDGHVWTVGTGGH
jgi:hypothetical protein